MRPEPSRRPGILSDRYEPLLDRFRDHARSLIQARAAAEDDATSARRAADAEIDERVAAFDLLLSEVSALAESVVSHPAARNLSEVDSAPVPTVYDDPSIDLLRGLYMRRRERAFAVLPDLSVPTTARRDAAMAPTADAKGTPRPDDGAHTFSESDREGGAPDGGTPPAELPVVASVPASTPSADVADAGNAPSGTEVVRCPHCAAEAPIGAEFCPACTRRMR